MKLSRLFQDFFNSEKSGSILLLICTVLSVCLANIFSGYAGLWHHKLFSITAEHWINDGLMAIFFLLIGLELEREIYAGELSDFKKASLPVIAAIGGMVVPALLFALISKGSEFVDGVGIPMATDIAFAIGILSLLGNKVPVSLKILLTALAVIDDLGAIIVIALFYTDDINIANLVIALAIFGVLLLLNRMKVRNLLPYLIGGIAMWYFMFHSGVHATIAGVLLAFAIPFGDGGEKSPSYILQKALHYPVAFFILPVFALANTAIVIPANWYQGLFYLPATGVIAGLALGKPAGIVLFSYLSVITGVCTLPSDINWKHVTGIGMLAGIGFTMSIFITLLAFDKDLVIAETKIAIIAASVISGVAGYIWLKINKR